MELAQLFTCSSHHVTREEALRFEADDPPIDCMVWRGHYGWMFSVGPESSFMHCQLSRGLRGAISVAQQQGAEYIRFDADFDQIPGVEVYRWD